MKRLFAVLILLGSISLLGPATTGAAKARTHSEDRNLSAYPRTSPRGTNRIAPKASCRSDSGDVCICGPGQKCTATATSCSCSKPEF